MSDKPTCQFCGKDSDICVPVMGGKLEVCGVCIPVLAHALVHYMMKYGALRIGNKHQLSPQSAGALVWAKRKSEGFMRAEAEGKA